MIFFDIKLHKIFRPKKQSIQERYQQLVIQPTIYNFNKLKKSKKHTNKRKNINKKNK